MADQHDPAEAGQVSDGAVAESTLAGASESTPTSDPGASYQSLYRRFRPQKFSQVLGQDHITTALANGVRDGRVSHAYLFSGPRGTGKTSTARILAKALNCAAPVDGDPCGICASCEEITRGSSLDVHELDAASNNGVDAMRDLVARAALGTPGRSKVYIVDEVHMLSTQASNALLKTLEEPPPHVVFVLATTDPQKVLPTIRSRTQHFEFRLLGPELLEALLRQVRDQAALGIDDGLVDRAVRRGRGSARDALSALDLLAAGGDVENSSAVVVRLSEAVGAGEVTEALTAVAMGTATGRDPAGLASELADELRQAFLSTMAPDLMTTTGADRARAEVLSRRLGLASLVRGMEILGQALVAMRDAPDPRAHLEVALVTMLRPEADAGALGERVQRLERLVADQSQTIDRLLSGAPVAVAAPSVTPSPAVATTTVTAGAGEPGPPATATQSPAAIPPQAGLPGSDRPLSGPALARQTLGALRKARAGSTTSPPAPAPQVASREEAPWSTETSSAATTQDRRKDKAGELPPTDGGPQTGSVSPSSSASALGQSESPGDPGGALTPVVDAGPDDGAGSAIPAGSSDSLRQPEPSSRFSLGPELSGQTAQAVAGDALPSRDDLVQAWGDFILPGLSGRARARFRAGRFLTVEGGVAVYALPNENHRSFCDEFRLEVEQAVSGHFGVRVKLQLTVDDEEEEESSGSGPTDSDHSGSVGASEAVATDAYEEPDFLDAEVLARETELAGAAPTAAERVRAAFPGAEEV